MRVRAVSSIAVVAVGLLPTLCGGPVFALLMATLAVLGYREFRSLGLRLAGPGGIATTGFAAGGAFALAPLADDGPMVVTTIAALAVGAPLVLAVVHASDGAFLGWAVAAAGSLYVGLPTYGAVALRSLDGTVNAEWLAGLAAAAAPGWADHPRGLAWVLIAILATWLGDTAAYLTGRRWGRRPLLQRVSPKKTVEGALAGLAGSALAGALGVAWFGLDVAVGVGVGVGLVLGAVGQLGDLSESLLKRQAGVKDSGDLIPGHGGILDRIDALLFALPTAWFLATLIDGAGTR